MCGIFGYIGKKNPLKTCLTGLKLLEYRGYDSAGISGIQDGKLFTCKTAGKIENLEKLLEEKMKTSPVHLELAIGHTRWATHGVPNTLNAHPHSDQDETLSLVHNGIIENYDEIKKKLQKCGRVFQTDTDTEVLAQLIAYHYKSDLLKAIKTSLKEVTGSLAVVLIHKDYPNHIIAMTRESPLAIGYDDTMEEIIVASDPNAFLGQNLNVFFLENDEIASLCISDLSIYNKKNSIIKKRSEKLQGENELPSKMGYEHFMLKEIFEQPLTIQKAMMNRYLEDFGTAKFFDLTFSSQELMATRHILIIACGTSWLAGSIAATMLEDKARIPTQAEIASELRFKNSIISDDTLVIAISQSGETADTIAAVREAKAKGAKILGICNVKNSTLTRESHSNIFLQAGPEFCVCSTKAFTSQLTVLSLFTLLMARLRHMGKKEGQLFIHELKEIPQKVNQVLELKDQIQSLAKKYSQYKNFFFLGRSYMYTTALEAALKLKEITYVNANAYPAGEMKHGPIALIDKNFPVVAFCSNKQSYEKMLNNLREVKSRSAPILAFAPIWAKELEEIADDIVYLPDTIDELSTFPTSVAGQLFAYYIAKEIGTEIDQPRNLAKSVTVE
jgi:glutamine---fructose-6-phosphate transaminase (isomerizing)